MATPRLCHNVIDEMLRYIPADQTELIKDLLWNKKDSMYKAPEETLQWHRTSHTLEKHIPVPTQEWHWKLMSIFSMKPIDVLKEQFK